MFAVPGLVLLPGMPAGPLGTHKDDCKRIAKIGGWETCHADGSAKRPLLKSWLARVVTRGSVAFVEFSCYFSYCAKWMCL